MIELRITIVRNGDKIQLTADGRKRMEAEGEAEVATLILGFVRSCMEAKDSKSKIDFSKTVLEQGRKAIEDINTDTKEPEKNNEN